MATTTTTPNMGIVKPNPKGSAEPQVGPTYAQDNDAALDTIDAHDHAAGNGVLVPVAGLNINADLALTGFDLTDVDAVVMDGQATIDLAKTRSIQFDNTADGDAYVVDGQGRSIQWTASGSLNATLVGGITGDYSTSTADLSYDNTAKAYELKQDVSPDHWANVKGGQLHVHEPGSGVVNSVQLKSPLSLAGTIGLELPDVLPASGEIKALTCDENGVVRADSAYSEEVRVIPCVDGAPKDDTINFTTSLGIGLGAVGVDLWVVGLPVTIGDTIVEIRVRVNVLVGSTVGRVKFREIGDGASATLATVDTDGTAGLKWVTHTPVTPIVVGTTKWYEVELEWESGVSGSPLFERVELKTRRDRV